MMARQLPEVCSTAISRFVLRTTARLHGRSVWLVGQFHRRMEMFMAIWLVSFMAIAAVRMKYSPTAVLEPSDFVELFLPYALIALAPVLAYRLTVAAFPMGRLPAPSTVHLSRSGRWRMVDVLGARQHAAFGPTGFMASLMLGLLLNVVLRSFEFMLAVPAMNSHAPEWGSTIFRIMAADVIAMNAIYAICFVLALRSVPHFPRMLGLAWMLDVTSQLMVAQTVSRTPGLPADVSLALGELLQGNVTKVLISAAVWLPYLLLSDRVNVTYRMRVARSDTAI